MYEIRADTKNRTIYGLFFAAIKIFGLITLNEKKISFSGIAIFTGLKENTFYAKVGPKILIAAQK